MKKFALTVFVIFFACFCFMLSGFSFFKKAPVLQPQQSTSYSSVQNKLWCVTFQLAWNELSEKFVGGNVNFVGGNPPLADELNKKLYTSEILTDDFYYTTSGKVSKKLKKDIEKSIYKKFKEKSDILDMIDWNAKNAYIFYSLLKKNFAFWVPFDRLSSAQFNNSKETVKYFGINDKSSKKLRKDSVTVLFYNSPDEYAISIPTKETDDVILYRTDKEDTFANYFDYISNNTRYGMLASEDEVKIPDVSVDKTISYDELCNKQIAGTEYAISQALQTIKFKMDNKGGSLKSEAAIGIMRTSLVHPDKNARKFFFDKPFILFLIENGKEKPYYAMKVDNTDFLVKE